MSEDHGNIEARLRRLEDLDAIRQLFIDYGRLLDQGAIEAYAELFTEDAELRLGPIGTADGREQIRQVMTKALAGVTGNSYHLITSPTIDLDGDRATTEVMWTVVVRGADGKPVVPMVGKHRYVVVRTPQGWRFARREGLIDIPSRYAGSGVAS